MKSKQFVSFLSVRGLSGVRQKFAFLCVVEITEAFPETDEICNPLVSLGLV